MKAHTNYDDDNVAYIQKNAAGTTNKGTRSTDIIYGINDTPPWYMSVFLGLQVLATTIHTCLLYTSPSPRD